MHVLKILVMSLSTVSMLYTYEGRCFCDLNSTNISANATYWWNDFFASMSVVVRVLYICNPSLSLSLSLSLCYLLCKHCISFSFLWRYLQHKGYIWRDTHHPLCHCLCFTCIWIDKLCACMSGCDFTWKCSFLCSSHKSKTSPVRAQISGVKLVILNVPPRIQWLSTFGFNKFLLALAPWGAHHRPLM